MGQGATASRKMYVEGSSSQQITCPTQRWDITNKMISNTSARTDTAAAAEFLPPKLTSNLGRKQSGPALLKRCQVQLWIIPKVVWGKQHPHYPATATSKEQSLQVLISSKYFTSLRAVESRSEKWRSVFLEGNSQMVRRFNWHFPYRSSH